MSTVRTLISRQPEGLGEWLGAVLSVPTVAVHRQREKFERHVESPAG